MRTLATALIAVLAATPAVAGDLQDGSGRKPWSANVGYGRVMDDGTDAASSPSYSGGLERAFGDAYVGFSGGYSARTTVYDRLPASVRAKGWSAGLYAGAPAGPVSLSASIDYGRENASALVLAGTRAIVVDASTEFLSAGGGASKTFGEGLRVTPSGSVYWSRTISSTEGQGGFASGRKSNDGVTGRLGLDFSADVAPRLSVSAGGAGVASSNAASVYRLSGLARTSAPQSFGESEAASWGEVSLGAALDLGAASLSVGAAATIGLAEDTVTVSVGASAPF